MLARRPALSEKRRAVIRYWLGRRFELKGSPGPAELLRLDEGYSLSRVNLREGTQAIGRTLGELALKDKTMQVLAIERGSAFIPVPRADDRILAGDQLIVYGATPAVSTIFAGEQGQALTLVAETLGREAFSGDTPGPPNGRDPSASRPRLS